MKKHQINIQTISPLHVGNGESITSIGQYVCTGNHIKIIDQDSLYKLLISRDILNDYLQFIKDFSKNTHVWDFFIKHQIENEIVYTSEMRLNATGFNPESNNILELAIETKGKKYIPGSSLKGAFRTAMLAIFIKEDASLKSRIEKIIRENNKLYDIREKLLNLEKELLDKVMHLFRVEDTSLVSENDVITEIAKRVHFFGVETKGFDNLRACIAPETYLETHISIIPQIEVPALKWLNFDSLSNFFVKINEITSQYIDFEKALLQTSTEKAARSVKEELESLLMDIKSADKLTAYMRLGKGKAFFFQVILPLLSSEAKDKVLSLLVEDAEKRKNYPKTRVLNDYNKMFGWVKITTPPPPEKQLINNEVKELIKNETVLKAYFIDVKTVMLKLNGIVIENVQLVNQFKVENEKDTVIDVMVQQITKEGKLNQVKLITE